MLTLDRIAEIQTELEHGYPLSVEDRDELLAMARASVPTVEDVVATKPRKAKAADA